MIYQTLQRQLDIEQHETY